MRFTYRTDASQLEDFLASKLDAPLSYPEVGASLGDRPAGYRHDSDELVLGAGDEPFRRAREGLIQWRAHRGAGVTVHPVDAPLEPATTVALALPLVGFHALAACRIVAVLDEPDRFGFAYGTLVGHPERGEEAFIVERARDTVTFHIHAFSKPADPLARLGAPVARHIQRRVTLRYLKALRRFAAS
jgi:uncharacterized protein (UPF0548 family)